MISTNLPNKEPEEGAEIRISSNSADHWVRHQTWNPTPVDREADSGSERVKMYQCYHKYASWHLGISICAGLATSSGSA